MGIITGSGIVTRVERVERIARTKVREEVSQGGRITRDQTKEVRHQRTYTRHARPAVGMGNEVEALVPLSSKSGTASPMVAFKQLRSVLSTFAGSGGGAALSSPVRAAVLL